MSDSLFGANVAEVPGSFSHFIDIFKTIEIGSESEQCKLIFQILDREGCGYISRPECQSLLNHSLANPAHLT